jgi:uncharacterized membrane protein
VREGTKLLHRAALFKKYGTLSLFMDVHKMVPALIFFIIFIVGERREMHTKF